MATESSDKDSKLKITPLKGVDDYSNWSKRMMLHFKRFGVYNFVDQANDAAPQIKSE